MNPDDILAHYSPQRIGREIQVYRETASTNDLVMALGKSGCAEGLVIFAESQTAGRGRLGRRWQSRPGLGLWFSILLRPSWPDFSRLSLAAAVAVTRGIAPFVTSSPGIKWPNDIWLREKKVAGILCEAAGDFVVAGIGLNVAHRLEDFDPELADRATSLALQSHATPNRAEVAASILRAFDELYARLPGAFPEVISECERRGVLQGKPVRVETGRDWHEGVVRGLDVSGGLLIETADGPRIITAGEVTAKLALGGSLPR